MSHVESEWLSTVADIRLPNPVHDTKKKHTTEQTNDHNIKAQDAVGVRHRAAGAVVIRLSSKRTFGYFPQSQHANLGIHGCLVIPTLIRVGTTLRQANPRRVKPTIQLCVRAPTTGFTTHLLIQALGVSPLTPAFSSTVIIMLPGLDAHMPRLKLGPRTCTKYTVVVGCR